MVVESFNAIAERRFVLRPNRSMTWRQTQKFYGLIASVTLTIACGFALLGYWPVLPFAGLELRVLGMGFWMCAASGRKTEVISIGDTIIVEKGTHTPRRVWQAPRAWAQVQLRRPSVAWYPSRLVLRSHGKEVPLGDFLGEEERRELAGKLKALVGTGVGSQRALKT